MKFQMTNFLTPYNLFFSRFLTICFFFSVFLVNRYSTMNLVLYEVNISSVRTFVVGSYDWICIQI